MRRSRPLFRLAATPRANRRLLDVGVPPLASLAGFWVLQRLDLMADTALWVLAALLLGGLGLNEFVRIVTPRAFRLRATVMVATIASVVYATGWGPILIIGFMYGIAAPVRRFGARALPTAFAMTIVAVALGQTAVAVGLAPTLIEERLAHGLAVLGFLGLTFPSWVIYTTATKKEMSEAELVHRATHDPLTHLPNRTLFVARLRRAIEQIEEDRSQVAVLFIDLDRFKVVNDSLGHEVGDLLLVGVAERIAGSVRPGDLVARLGGDEFAVLLGSVSHVNDAVQVADRLHREFEMPFVLDGYEVVTTASVGIALSGDNRNADNLLRDADVAMYHAKRRGGGRYEVFDEQMGVRALWRLELEGRLRRALEDRDFSLHYQPEVALDTGKIIGVEALVRWVDPVTGEVPLEDLIPVAEETGLIVPLGRWVLEQACTEARSWFGEDAIDSASVVAINISARQFQQPDLVGQTSAVIGAAGLDPARVRLEITESAVMYDPTRGVDLVHELKALGVQIALDDFGTGHSSLSSLSNLPADVLKLDRSFVDRMSTDAAVPAIIVAVITMAHELGLSVVAEGVETAEQLRTLRKLGCDSSQGYLFSPPVPSDRAVELLRDGSFPLDDLAMR